ncbi:unnamed protein product, partial [Rotaria sp. Silwood1]
HAIESGMSTSHHQRSSSTRSSRRPQINAYVQPQRSASVPSRQFIIILTNNSELLRQTRQYQPRVLI